MVVESVQKGCFLGKNDGKWQVTCTDYLVSTHCFIVYFHSLESKRKNTCHIITSTNTSSLVSIFILLRHLFLMGLIDLTLELHSNSKELLILSLFYLLRPAGSRIAKCQSSLMHVEIIQKFLDDNSPKTLQTTIYIEQLFWDPLLSVCDLISVIQ